MVKLSKRTIAYIFLLINVVVWGASLPIVKLGLGFTTPFRYLTYRYALAILFSLPILYYYWPKIRNVWKAVKTIAILELLGTTLALGFLYVGLSQTTSLEASLITTTTPIFTTFFGIWWLHEKEERHEWVGMSIAFIGTVAMTFLPVIISGGPMFGGSFSGNLLVFLQNIATAAYFILAKRYYKNIHPLFVSSVGFYVGFITFGLLSLLEVGGSLEKLLQVSAIDLTHPSVWLIAVYMATFGSIIGLSTYIKGQDLIEASEASTFGYLQPLIYIPLGMVLLHENASVLQIVLLGVVLFGVFIAEKRFRSRRSHTRNRK